jgi:hypothetical protein
MPFILPPAQKNADICYPAEFFLKKKEIETLSFIKKGKKSLNYKLAYYNKRGETRLQQKRRNNPKEQPITSQPANHNQEQNANTPSPWD